MDLGSIFGVLVTVISFFGAMLGMLYGGYRVGRYIHGPKKGEVKIISENSELVTDDLFGAYFDHKEDKVLLNKLELKGNEFAIVNKSKCWVMYGIDEIEGELPIESDEGELKYIISVEKGRYTHLKVIK